VKLSSGEAQHGPEQGSKKEKKQIAWVDYEFPLIVVAGLVLALLLSAALSFYVYQSQVLAKKEQQLSNITSEHSQRLANDLSRYLNTEQEKVNFFASQSLLVNALRDGDKRILVEMEKSLRRQVRDIESLSFLPAGMAKLDAERKPPIRFSELTLIQQVEAGEQPDPEAVNLEGKWLVHYFSPIKQAGDDATLEGVLWVSTALTGLQQHMREASGEDGAIHVYQNFGGQSVRSVFQYGAKQTSYAKRSSSALRQWELDFTLSQQRASQVHIDASMVYLVAALASVLLCAIGGFIAYKVAASRQDARTRKQLELEMFSTVSSDGSAPVGFASVSISDEDQGLLGLEGDESDSTSDVVEELSLDEDVFDLDDDAPDLDTKFPAEVFRAYDVRGLAETQITKEFALHLGKALGSELLEQGQNTIVVARDARSHSPTLTEYLIRGLLSTGCNVLNIGTVPTPLMYFAVATMDELSSGVVVTASHNGPEWNGFKMVLNGISRSTEDIQALRTRMLKSEYRDGVGQENHHDIMSAYIDTIFSDVALAGDLHIVIDAANGVAGKVAPSLFEELGCQVESLFCDLDGTFPNHAPDPSVESNLTALIEKVQEVGADLGLAFDGDGDRLVAVSNTGKIYSADKLLMLFATDIISRSPGSDVIFDVKSTRHLNSCITNAGGRPIMWKTGHSLMRQKMQETGAVVGAEFSGHIFIRDRWFGFDDGLYAAARLLEVLTLQDESLDEAFEAFPSSIATPEYRVRVSESEKFDVIEKLKKVGDFGEGKLTKIDGVRVDFGYGWGLVRASNTGPELTLRFEADTEENIHQLKALFVKELKKVESTIEVDWENNA